MFITIIILWAGIGAVNADLLPGDGPETQGIVSTTTISCVGTVTKADVIQWRASNEYLDANMELHINEPGDPYYDPDLPEGEQIWIEVPEPPMKFPGEIQMVSAYTETTEAKNGYTEYTKTLKADTAGKDFGLSNVETHRNIQFTGIAAQEGRITSAETHAIDLAGLNNVKITSTLCPLVNPFELPTCWPPFCSIEEVGSTIDMSVVSIVTDASSRTLSKGQNLQDPPVPGIADIPASLHYDISVTGLSPAEYADGRVVAFMKVHAQDGVSNCALPNVGSELTYTEETIADGRINTFTKIMDYESGVLRPF